jgi:hypothetical protein
LSYKLYSEIPDRRNRQTNVIIIIIIIIIIITTITIVVVVVVVVVVVAAAAAVVVVVFFPLDALAYTFRFLKLFNNIFKFYLCLFYVICINSVTGPRVVESAL